MTAPDNSDASDSQISQPNKITLACHGKKIESTKHTHRDHNAVNHSTHTVCTCSSISSSTVSSLPISNDTYLT